MISFKSVGHAFASVISKLHAGLQAIEKVLPGIQSDEKVVEGVTALIPGKGAQTALAVERVAFGVLGEVAAVVSALDDAALANGVSVPLDAEVAGAVKVLVTDFKDELVAVGLMKAPAPVAAK